MGCRIKQCGAWRASHAAHRGRLRPNSRPPGPANSQSLPRHNPLNVPQLFLFFFFFFIIFLGFTPHEPNKVIKGPTCSYTAELSLACRNTQYSPASCCQFRHLPEEFHPQLSTDPSWATARQCAKPAATCTRQGVDVASRPHASASSQAECQKRMAGVQQPKPAQCFQNTQAG